jgi:hypothetical protein
MKHRNQFKLNILHHKNNLIIPPKMWVMTSDGERVWVREDNPTNVAFVILTVNFQTRAFPALAPGRLIFSFA